MFVHSWRSIKNQNQPWKQVPKYLEELSLALMPEDFDNIDTRNPSEQHHGPSVYERFRKPACNSMDVNEPIAP